MSIEEQARRRLALEAERGKKPKEKPLDTMEQRIQERLELHRKGVPLKRAVEISQHDVR